MRVGLIALALVPIAGCAGRSDLHGPADAGAPDADAAVIVDSGPPPIERADKVDLLLVLDNSKNTGVAQELFAETVPYLLGRLTKPACVNGLGNVVAETPSTSDACPIGQRDFRPVTDFHVAVISTSLGGHGADVCGPQSPTFTPEMNDAAHLLTRDGTGGVVPTYENHGFLDWDPGQVNNPPGESDLPTLTTKLTEMVHGVGTRGCGFESQLESIYRFLVDPDPYLSIAVTNYSAIPSGTDTVVLQQRADFVRPDSAVVVLLMTDENDCSTREGGQYYLANQSQAVGGGNFHLPHARSVCATHPDDPCCASCGEQTPEGCPPNDVDPGCQPPTSTDAEDPINLRCYDQKRRFGVDFLYPVDRYVKALSEATVTSRDNAVVPNPLFVGGRSPKLVILAGIVGVPWQDIANDPNVLANGFRPGSEIDWATVLGAPGTLPLDPLMIESIAPRTGENPATHDALAPPTATPLENPINGHERTIAALDDLQYTCIYERPQPQDCSANATDCECLAGSIDTNPICQNEDGTYGTVQRYARALPSVRPLRVLQGLGDQGVVASVCPQNVGEPSGATFAYKPAVDAVMRALRDRLK